MFGGCGTLTSLLASPPRSSIASGSSSVYTLHVCMAARKSSSVHVPLSTCCPKCAWRNAFACVDARSRVCASERNRAYVTAWLGAQIQRAQLAHRTSRRIVLILRLHSRGAEEASYRLEPTGRLCFKAGKRQGFWWILEDDRRYRGGSFIGFLLTDLVNGFRIFFFCSSCNVLQFWGCWI